MGERVKAREENLIETPRKFLEKRGVLVMPESKGESKEKSDSENCRL